MISITYTKLCAMPPTETPISLKASVSFYPNWNPFPFLFYVQIFTSSLSCILCDGFSISFLANPSFDISFFFYNTLLPLKKRRNLWINTRIYALRKDDNEKLAHPDLDDMIYAAIEFSRLQHLSLSDIYAILC